MTATRTGTLRVATRRSKLAWAQAQAVADQLTALTGRAVRMVGLSTEGDVSATAVQAMAGTGVFVTALRQELFAGSVDLAVHSLKDLPTAAPEGLLLAAVPGRADPRDALVSRDDRRLGELATGARVGTSAPRRVAQLRAVRPDLDVVPVRGNVDTRLAKVRDGVLDAVVVAQAGLVRLGRASVASEVFEPALLTPAPGQGALAVECRADDLRLAELLARLDDRTTRTAVTAERAVLAGLRAGCSAPVGALARHRDPDTIRLDAVVARPDGTTVIRRNLTGPSSDAADLGHRLAAALLEAGAAELMRECA